MDLSNVPPKCASTPSFSCEAALRELNATERAVVQSRLKLLSEKLRSTSGYQLRDDSRLAFLSATGQLGPSWTDDVVCHEMACVQFICDTTPYTDVLQSALRRLANELKSKYKIRDWATVWKIVRSHGPDVLKYLCMADSGLLIPDFATPKKKTLWSDECE